MQETTAAREAAGGERDIAARLERLPLTWTRVKARIVMGMATFFDGYDTLALGIAMPVLKETWQLSNGDVAWLLGGTSFGQLLGALLFPTLAELLGRLRAASYSVWVVGLGALGCFFAINFNWLLGLRFVQGIGIGGEIPVASTYINEIANARVRGRFFLMYESAFAFGYLACSALGALLIGGFGYGWQPLFLIGALPALVAGVMRLMLPESPRWLAAKGRAREADGVVSGMEREAEAKLGELPPPELASVPPPAARGTNPLELLSRDYRVRTLVVWSIWGFSFFVTQALNGWLPAIYKGPLHLSTAGSLNLALAGHSFSILAALTAAMVVDRIGRRSWLTIALGSGGLSLLVLAVLGAGNPYVVLVFATIASFFLSSVSVTIYVFTAELYPTRVRALGTGAGSVVRNLFAMASPFAVAFMLDHAGLASVFIMLGLAPLVPAFMVTRYGTETKGRVLEEISR